MTIGTATIKTALSAFAIAGPIAGGAAAGTKVSPRVDVGGGKGLVVVDLSQLDVDALQNIANDLNVEVEDVADINSVQLPINAAAAVCNIDVNAIANSNDRGDKTCTAHGASETLARAVQQSMNQQ